MSKKIFELAKELGMGGIDLVERLREKGFAVRNHMQVLGTDEIKKITNAFKQNDKKEKKVPKKKVKKKVVRTSSKEVTKKNIIRKKKGVQKSKQVETDTSRDIQAVYESQQETLIQEKDTEDTTGTKKTIIIRKEKTSNKKTFGGYGLSLDLNINKALQKPCKKRP